MKQPDTPVKVRETLLVIVLGFLVLHLIFEKDWMIYTSLVAGIAGMVSLRLNRWIHLFWFFLGEKLGFVVGKVVLGIVYLVVLLPMSFLARIFRKDLMNLRAPGKPAFTERDHEYNPDDFIDMW